MVVSAPLFTIVLAAGKGRRMRNRYMHKVCFEIAGVPTIVRSLDTFNRLGTVQNVVVVGEMAGQVVETVGERFSNVVFAYQPHALGTGDAARCGLQALAPISDSARVLVVAGDKIIDSQILSQLLAEFDAAGADLAMLASPAEHGGASAGRVLVDQTGRPAAIAEVPDIRLRACRAALREQIAAFPGEITGAWLQGLIAEHGRKALPLPLVFGSDVGKQLEAFPPAAPLDRQLLARGLDDMPAEFTLSGDGQRISAAEALRAPLRNESVYLVRKGVLSYGLQHIGADNAQGEQYLTDAIGAILAARDDHGIRFRAAYVATSSPHDIMSYNDPEELLRITDYFQGRSHQSLGELAQRLGTSTIRTVQEWLELFPDHDQPVPQTDASLAENYGDDPALIQERRRAYRMVLLRFAAEFGEQRHAILVRSPGRINIMGRHIDYQGGRCNLMAVNQEVIMAVAPRDDDRIELRNAQPELFPDATISLGRLVSQLNWDDWLSCINCEELERHLRDSAGKWSIYVEAAMLRMQMAFRQRVLQGMDLMVLGNIPVAAGMSSSSALVVSTAEAAAALHGLEVTASQFVNFCGEGEWFVGTRGGSADHAAMKYGAKGTINHVKFHDFELLEQIPFPKTHRLVVCNSFMQAKKAAGAKLAFNSRVASYRLGVTLVRRQFPQFAPLIRYVRDIAPEVLHVPPQRIYEILLALPESLTAGEVRREFASDEAWDDLASYFQRAESDCSYPVRGVLWFGIAECARAREAAVCLRQRDLRMLGELMKISHDGERCFRVDDELGATPFSVDISDERLHALIDDLNSWDHRRVTSAQLHRQPGAYRCSIREIDALVDIACRTPGVLGAQIAGAGLGGCAMILAETATVPKLQERLDRMFYQPSGLPSGVMVCSPSAGSSLLRIADG
jgi:N-acetylgalactosamine kinase